MKIVVYTEAYTFHKTLIGASKPTIRVAMINPNSLIDCKIWKRVCYKLVASAMIPFLGYSIFMFCVWPLGCSVF